MPRPEELRLTEYGSEDSDYDEDIFNNSIIHSYEKKVCMIVIKVVNNYFDLVTTDSHFSSIVFKDHCVSMCGFKFSTLKSFKMIHMITFRD